MKIVILTATIMILLSVGLTKVTPRLQDSEEPSRIELWPLSMRLKVGQTAQAKAEVYSSNGTKLNLKVGWLPGSYSTCVTVDGAGVVTATRPGQCGVSALTKGPKTAILIAKTPIQVLVEE